MSHYLTSVSIFWLKEEGIYKANRSFSGVAVFMTFLCFMGGWGGQYDCKMGIDGRDVPAIGRLLIGHTATTATPTKTSLENASWRYYFEIFHDYSKSLNLYNVANYPGTQLVCLRSRRLNNRVGAVLRNWRGRRARGAFFLSARVSSACLARSPTSRALYYSYKLVGTAFKLTTRKRRKNSPS